MGWLSRGYFNTHILLKHYQLCNLKFIGTTSDKASTDTVHSLSLLFYSHFNFNALFYPFPFSSFSINFPIQVIPVNNHFAQSSTNLYPSSFSYLFSPQFSLYTFLTCSCLTSSTHSEATNLFPLSFPAHLLHCKDIGPILSLPHWKNKTPVRINSLNCATTISPDSYFHIIDYLPSIY